MKITQSKQKTTKKKYERTLGDAERKTKNVKSSMPRKENISRSNPG